MKWYLHLHHDLGEPKDEWIGPFDRKRDAWDHQQQYGPVAAEILVDLKAGGSALDALYSPEWHIQYLKGRT